MHVVYVAQFLQEVAPLFVFRLNGALYGDVASDIDAESLFGGETGPLASLGLPLWCSNALQVLTLV